MKRFILVVLLSFVLLPTSAFADPIACPAPTGNQLFDPNGQVPSGYGSGSNSFNGINFSGIGGAVAGCANLGGLAIDGIRNLFNISSSVAGVGGSVPVNDAAAFKQLAAANQRENCLNAAAYAVSKIALQKISDKTLKWVQTGFGGNPFYVRDIDSYLKSISDEKIAAFLSDVPNSDPIFGIALRSTLTQQVTGRVDGRINQVMDTPEARAYQEFQNDFTKGGWGAMLNPQNNPVGAYFNAVDSLSTQIDTAQQNVKDELNQGSGFLSMKKCVEYAPAATSIGTGITQAGANAATAGARAAALNKPPTCLRYETTTPGDLISKQASNILNSPANQLVAADSINEVLGSFFDSLLNRVYTAGLSNLGGPSTGPGSNLVTGVSGNTVSGSQSTLDYQTSCTDGYSGDFDISRPQQLRAVIQTQKNYFNRIADSSTAISSLIPSLGELDYCLPGPNPTWETGLAENYNAFTSSFQTDTRTNNILFVASVTKVKFIAQPSLFDKTKNQYQEIRPWEFKGDSSVGTIVGANFNGQNLNSLYGFFRNGYNLLLANYKNTFTEDRIVGAFTSVVPAADYATTRGNIIESLKETASLPNYAQTIPAYESYYSQSKDQVAQNLTELEAINREVLQIVATAKARYIKERAAANNPVNQQCIDAAYVVDVRPINGVPQKQTGPANPAIQTSKDASAYFYTTL